MEINLKLIKNNEYQEKQKMDFEKD